MRNANTAARPLKAGGKALPAAVLGSIVGGAGPRKNDEVTADASIALTAGAEHGPIETEAKAVKDGTGDVVTNAEKEFRENVSTKAAGPSGAGLGKDFVKLEMKRADGQWDKEVSSKDWTDKAEDMRAKIEKAALGEQKSAHQELGQAKDDLRTLENKVLKENQNDPVARAEVAKLADLDHTLAAAKADLAKTKMDTAARELARFGEKDGPQRASLEAALQKATAEHVGAQEALKSAADTKAKLAEAAKSLQAKEEAAKKADDKVQAAKTMDRAAIEKAMQQADREALKNAPQRFIEEKAWSKLNEAVRDELTKQAKELAKANGTHHTTEHGSVLAGGVTVTVAKDGDTTVTDKTIAQVKTEGSTATYSSALGAGAEAAWAIRAEAGTQTTKTVDLGGGKSVATTDKAYASASFENKAGASVTYNGASAEASTKVVLHAEASHTEALKSGIVEVKETASAQAHAEAGAKAGASLGFDGASLGASASAEASAKANLTNDVKIGDVAIKHDLEVYAKAKAEAKASATVNFNPLGKEGIGVKAGVGAEAAAGVGVQGTTGFKGSGGGGAEVGGGLYAGKIGAKADVDFGVKDGRISAGVNLGASLGVGFSVNIKIESNIKKAMDNAARDIAHGNFGEKVLGVLTDNPVGGFVRGLFS